MIDLLGVSGSRAALLVALAQKTLTGSLDLTDEGAEKGRETQNLKQAPGSALSAQSPRQGSNSRTARS